MEWNKYTIKTLTTAEDAISGMLMELGIYGVEIEDNIPISEEDKKTMFIDILPELPIDDGTAYISFYLEEGEKERETVEAVKAGLTRLREFVDIGEWEIVTSSTKEEDWINNWKEFFKPFTVDNIVIKPTWENLDEDNIIDITKNDKTDRESMDDACKERIVIEIDPGTAFGTGRHETTRLCMGQLRKYIKAGMRVLDAGAGSGVLSIVAEKLGAGFVFGTDIDPIAVEAAERNLILNGIDKSRFTMTRGNLIDDADLRKRAGEGSFDLVVANILADVIIPMSKVIPSLLKKDGVFISSGIINTKETEVKAAIEEAGFKILDIVHLNEWVAIIATL
ncbi:MAG: 50S ribosomal protein L11 methyltransferase [Lachnospiraceae bacterium]|nr:50S ribosomal protein L11 methyltransferase [Lachnospiraceae bacterium]